MAVGRAFQGQGMNRTRLMMIGVLALAVGFLAAVYVYRNLQPKSSMPAETENAYTWTSVSIRERMVGRKARPARTRILGVCGKLLNVTLE